MIASAKQQGEPTNQEVRIREGQTTLSTTKEQKEELESITDYIVPNYMRRKGSPAVMAFIRMLTSKDSNVLRSVAAKITEYADRLDREGNSEKSKPNKPSRRSQPLNSKPSASYSTVISE